MRTHTLSVLLLALAACATETSTVEPAPPTEATPTETAPVEQAVDPELQAFIDLAIAVRANPDNAATLLEQAGQSADDFQAKLLDIAADPTASAEYARQLGH